MSTLFVFYQGNKSEVVGSLCSIELRRRSIQQSCSELHPCKFKNADDWLSFQCNVKLIFFYNTYLYK